MSLRVTLLIAVPLALTVAAPFGYSLTQTASLPKFATAKIDRKRKSAERLCASRIVNDRLKSLLFNEAASVGGGASANLDLLSSFSEVRMEQPVLKAQDSDLGVTVCKGRFVVLLPPGSERGFGGMRVLSADVEYAAQPAADGSGFVYQLKGADSIVYRIAAFSLRHHTIVPRDVQMAKAEPGPDMPLAIEPAVWPELRKPEEAAPKPVAPVQVAEAEKPAEPVKLAAAEPKPAAKPEAPVKVAKAEPKPVEKAKPKPKPVAFAAVVKKEAAPAKPKPKPVAAPKPTGLAKAEKPAAKAPAKKEAPAKLAQKTPAVAAKPKTQLAQKKPVAEKPKTQVAQKKAVPVDKPKTQLAAVTTKKAPEPKRDLTTNSFLAYEQARQREQAPAPAPARAPAVVQRASAPAPRNDCNSGGIEARLVCANPGLAQKQRAATNFYYASLEQASQDARRELTGSRNRFLAYLDRCRSAACASAAYDDRMAEIRDIMREF